MAWFPALISIFVVAVGWALSQYAKYFEEKKAEKKKLKKLLYFLLELRFHISRSIVFEKGISNYIQTIQETLSKDFNIGSIGDIATLEQVLKQVFKKIVPSDESSLEFLEKNIDQAVLDLAEILPIFAYELTGQYKIKDSFRFIDNYFNEVDTLLNGELLKQIPFDLKQWIQPKLTQDFLTEFDSTLIEISKRIDHEIKSKVEKKIALQNAISHSIDVTKLIGEFIEKMK